MFLCITCITSALYLLSFTLSIFVTLYKQSLMIWGFFPKSLGMVGIHSPQPSHESHVNHAADATFGGLWSSSAIFGTGPA